MDDSGPSLVSLRLHWYARATARLLLRRWQATVLVLAIALPAGVPVLALLKMLAAPFGRLYSQDHSYFVRLSMFVSLIGVGILWVSFQRDAVLGGRFNRFLASLPLPAKSFLLADLVVLAIADSPLWLPLCICLVLPQPGIALHSWVSVDFLLRAAGIVLFAGIVISAQLAILQARSMRLSWCALATILLCGSIDMPGAILQFIALAVAALTLALGLQPPWVPGPVKRSARSAARQHIGHGQLDQQYLFAPIVLHSMRLLTRQYRGELLVRVMVVGMVVSAACALMQMWDFDTRALGLVVIVLAMKALILSGLYRTLHMAHLSAAPVFGALPLVSGWWARRDITAVMLAAMPFAVFLCGVLLAQSYAWSAALKLLLADVLLLSALRYPQVHARRHAVVIAAGMAALWFALTMAAVI